MKTQIIYFKFKDFHVPFMSMQSIGFKFFAKIMRESCVFWLVGLKLIQLEQQAVLVLTLQTTLKQTTYISENARRKIVFLKSRIENQTSNI